MNSMLNIKNVKHMVPGRHPGDCLADSGYIGMELRV